MGAELAKPLSHPKTWKIINLIIGGLCIYMASQFIHNFNNPNHDHSHINLFGVHDDLFENSHNHGIDR